MRAGTAIPRVTIPSPNDRIEGVVVKQQTVIVGAGSAGSTLAARLSEDPEHEVILIEAGPDYPDRSTTPPSILNPYDIAEDHDWGFGAFFTEPPESRDIVKYPRGKLVGGSSAVNASFAGRGYPSDFQEWVDLGNDAWSWKHVAPYFERLETDLDFGAEAGPITITRVDRDLWPAAMLAFEEAALQRGYLAAPDYNAPDSTGVGPATRNQSGDIQANGLLTYIEQARSRPNLIIRSDVRVRRVLFEGHAVSGLELITRSGGETLAASRVVLCAGSIMSPHILMHSGIGPADVLAQFEIPVVHVLKGVGRNLQDHPLIFTFCILAPEPPGKRFGSLAMLKTAASGSDYDDIIIFPAVLEPSALLLDIEVGDRKALAVAGQVAKPRSVGWLTLKSADPDVVPEIHLNFMSDRRDLDRMMEVTRLGYDLATTEAMSAHIERILFPDDATISDDALLERWIRASVSTGYHAVGTCRMGAGDDPMAVVSQRLAVHGLSGLWVADASVMPTITTGLTNLTAFMIGERTADILTGRDGTLSGLQRRCSNPVRPEAPFPP
jgi:choline dehydrogenase